jgi:hypothetical protein
MKGREVITLLRGAAAAWPLGVLAQQPTMALIGLLSGTHQDDRWLAPCGRASRKPAIPKAAILPSNIAPPMVTSIDCRR